MQSRTVSSAGSGVPLTIARGMPAPTATGLAVGDCCRAAPRPVAERSEPVTAKRAASRPARPRGPPLSGSSVAAARSPFQLLHDAATRSLGSRAGRGSLRPQSGQTERRRTDAEARHDDLGDHVLRRLRDQQHRPGHDRQKIKPVAQEPGDEVVDVRLQLMPGRRRSRRALAGRRTRSRPGAG